MKKSFNTLFLASLTVFVLVAFALAPVAEAARGGGGRGGGGGGGGDRQINNSQRDARANNVRNTSVNNVNSSRNVNRNTNRNVNRDVNVDVDGGCCDNGWDNDYHPIAAAAAVTATAVVIGSMVNTVPANCAPVNYGGIVYQQCGNTWYQPQGAQFVVVNPPY